MMRKVAGGAMACAKHSLNINANVGQQSIGKLF